MAGYLESRPVIVQVDGYQREESESRYVNVSGDDFSGHLDFVDDAKARFGSSDELHIYTESSGSGHSYIQGDNIVIRSAAGTARLTVTSNDVDVSSGALKIGGTTVIDSSRAITADGLTINNSGQSQSLLSVGGGSTHAALSLRGSTGSAYAWQISSNAYFASALEFTKSTAVGGTTFSTPSMILDNSGNLLVGKTTIATGTAGIALRSNGEVRGTANGDYAARFSRLSSDGAIVGFEKDGAVVGSIGTLYGDIYVGTGDTGLKFTDSANVIVPLNTSTLAERDAAVSLGQSGTRFKDLFLSGVVYGSDTSGNPVGNHNPGYMLHPTNGSHFQRDGGNPLRVGRDASDGSLTEWYRQGALVGNVGIQYTDNFYVAGNSSHTGIGFGSSTIYPVDSTGTERDDHSNLGSSNGRFKDLYLSGGVKWTEGQVEINSGRLLQRSTGNASGLRFDGSGYTPFKNGSVADGTVDLGYSSGRYNNLYLSGGVYLGGVVGANKLDEYEEGTWTVNLYKGGSALAVTNRYGYYTRIGNICHFKFYWYYTGSASTSGSSVYEMGGFPFALIGAANSGYQFCPAGYTVMNSVTYYNYHRWQANNSTRLQLYGNQSGTNHSSGVLEFSGSGAFRVS